MSSILTSSLRMDGVLHSEDETTPVAALPREHYPGSKLLFLSTSGRWDGTVARRGIQNQSCLSLKSQRLQFNGRMLAQHVPGSGFEYQYYKFVFPVFDGPGTF